MNVPSLPHAFTLCSISLDERRVVSWRGESEASWHLTQALFSTLYLRTYNWPSGNSSQVQYQ